MLANSVLGMLGTFAWLAFPKSPQQLSMADIIPTLEPKTSDENK